MEIHCESKLLIVFQFLAFLYGERGYVFKNHGERRTKRRKHQRGRGTQ